VIKSFWQRSANLVVIFLIFVEISVMWPFGDCQFVALALCFLTSSRVCLHVTSEASLVAWGLNCIIKKPLNAN